jgi:hypothetical protein
MIQTLQEKTYCYFIETPKNKILIGILIQLAGQRLYRVCNKHDTLLSLSIIKQGEDIAFLWVSCCYKYYFNSI